jgi:hypothetical protein
MGGASTVVTNVKPRRNDTSIPAYGYDESKGHCIAYPFIDDHGETRLDFVNFSHDHARLIAAAPDLLGALRGLMVRHNDGSREGPWAEWDTATEAVAKATGQS